MKILDPGHSYELNGYDGASSAQLIFMKREGPGYPGNTGHYGGTNCQEVIRALIDRVLYLQNQIPCEENIAILTALRQALLAFETRAMRRHGIETLPSCSTCGHVACCCGRGEET